MEEKVPADMTYKEWENKFVVDVDNDIDYMSNSFRPRYGKAKEVYIDKIKMIVRPVKNSSFEMLTDTSNPRNKAVRLAEKIFREIQKELPETFEMPKIAVVDFKKQGLNKNAIGDYHQNFGTLFINKSSQYTEIVAECFSVKENNIVARGIIQILEEV